MDKPQLEINAKASFIPVLLGLGLAGLLLGLTADRWFPSQWDGVSELAILLCLAASIAWLLQMRWPRLGEGFLVTAFALIVFFGSLRLDLPILLALLLAPNMLAAALIGFRASLGLALAETLALALLYLSRPDASLAIILLVLWVCLLILSTIMDAARHTAGWAWQYYQNALTIRQEAFQQQEVFNQAHKDLLRANLQLTRLNKLAQTLRQAAEDARTAKEQFVANVSHELRTPLNMIIGFSETMLQSPETYGGRIPPALLADLTVVHRNAEHLSALIDDILDLSQVEMGEMVISREPVHFQEIIEDGLVAVLPLFESRQLTLKTDLQPNLPVVFCDRVRMREVILNLLSNAGRFTEQGGALIKAWADERNLNISVADTGMGIRPENMQKLFQPFSQVDGSIRRRFSGSGLGLSISKRFIELHHGRIWAESVVGQGSTFFFTIPLRPPGPLEENPARELVPDWDFLAHPRPFQSPKTADRPRFVLVERGKTLQRFLSRYLEGVECVAAPDWPHALEEVNREPARALILNEAFADLPLPLENASLPEGTPVFICSVAGFDEEADQFGAACRLVKPVQREALRQVIERFGAPGGTILVVDDDPDTLQMLGRILASFDQNYRSLAARNGQEALEILKDVRPDLILLDLIMPGMDGSQLLAEMKRRPEQARIPVVVISARDPSQQPIVSQAFTVTQKGGFSLRQVLGAIEFASGSALNESFAERSTPPGTASD